MSDKLFPINTATSCKLKWVWSTLYLNTGITRSCHRTAETKLTPENFSNFHNTDIKIQDRRDMLAGQWPEKNCGYCVSIEDTGGTSDRMRHALIPYSIPPELLHDSNAVTVSPTVLEVYFNNTCNLGCLYCSPSLSSTIAAENQRHGEFKEGQVWLRNTDSSYKSLVPYFWQWFKEKFTTVSRLHILGGEPFYQRELDELLDMIDRYPNSNCELNVITNLAVSRDRLTQFVDKVRSLLVQRKLKRVDITCSIDCWGKQQEYVRWPLDLAAWEDNFSYLLSHKYLYITINQTISVLTIKTMPALLEKLAEWRKIRKVGHWFGEVGPNPEYLKPYILGGKIFSDDFEKILSLMPVDTTENAAAHRYMQGIASHIASHDPCPEQIRDMIIYLDEKDRRRGTDWRSLFPWLTQVESYVV
jgi:hypothetical protein